MVNILEVKAMLEKAFTDAKVVVEDSMGDGHHLEAVVVSNMFINKDQKDRHQMVYDALGSIVGQEIHAFSLITKTFDESDNNATAKSYDTYKPSIPLNNDILLKIHEAINKHDVILFMKGTKEQPMCGFSATACAILQELGVEFMDVNVLASNEIRENIKIYSNWNTVPQLFIKGYFVGGCDLMKEMYQSGELIEILKVKNVAHAID